MARLVRGEFLTLREREFVDAARVSGARDRRIIFRHILPNAVGVIVVNATLLMAGAILLESALSYLGFGVQSPDTSLGKIVSRQPGGVLDAPVAVLVARCLHHRDRAVRQLHRRRSARRVRPAPEEEAERACDGPRRSRARVRLRPWSTPPPSTDAPSVTVAGEAVYTSADIVNYHDTRPEEPGDVQHEPLDPER